MPDISVDTCCCFGTFNDIIQQHFYHHRSHPAGTEVIYEVFCFTTLKSTSRFKFSSFAFLLIPHSQSEHARINNSVHPMSNPRHALSPQIVTGRVQNQVVNFSLSYIVLFYIAIFWSLPAIIQAYHRKQCLLSVYHFPPSQRAFPARFH